MIWRAFRLAPVVLQCSMLHLRDIRAASGVGTQKDGEKNPHEEEGRRERGGFQMKRKFGNTRKDPHCTVHRLGGGGEGEAGGGIRASKA